MKLFKCEKCGNIIEFVNETNPNIMCCGEVLSEVVINSTDASHEKHVPVYEIMDKKIKVSVGETLHPMEDNHNIAWILLENNNKTIKKFLNPGDTPIVKFPYIKGSVVYAYCGVHGIFKTEIK